MNSGEEMEAMMSKAAELLKRTVVKRKETEKQDRLVINDLDKEVRLFGRPTRLKVAVRYWRMLERREKELSATMSAVKNVIRAVACEAADDSNTYVSSVIIGPARVSRQNRFQPVEFTRDEIVEAIGETEYRIMFGESAVVEFDSIPEMRGFVKRCGLAGVEVGGKVREVVKAKKCVVERVFELGDALGEDNRQLVLACAKDAQMTVGRERIRV